MTIAPPRASTPVDVPADPRRWPSLAVLLLATAMGMLDLFIVNVAAPSIQNDLGADFSQAQLVLAIYLVAYAVGLVTGGRLGDGYGRRRLFALGVAAFTATSLGCALAPTVDALIAMRALQGISAALMLPQVLSVIQVAFPAHERPRALALYTATAGLASIAGQLVGGGLIALAPAGVGWRSVFLVNVPVGLAALALTGRWIPESRAPRTPRPDLVGVALLSVALVALLLALSEGAGAGWPAWASGCVAAGAAAFAGFAAWERRVERRGATPLVPPQLLAQRDVRLGLAIALLFYSGNSAMFVLLAYELQDGLGLSALASGLVFAPLGTGFAIASLLGRRAVERLGVQALRGGAACMALGLLMAAASTPRPHAFPWALAGALLVAGFGQGLVAAPLIHVVLGRASLHDAGAASGVLLTATQVSNALGVAVFGALFAALLGSSPRRGSPATPADFAAAFHASLVVLAAISAIVGALLGMLAGPRARGR